MVSRGLHQFYVALGHVFCALLIVGGCSVNVNHSERQYACEASDVCPSGQECFNGRCILPCSETSCAIGEMCVERECVPEDSGSAGKEILNYSFDDYRFTGVVHDRSGNRLDGYFEDGKQFVTGRFGQGLEFENPESEYPTGIDIPRNAVLFSDNTITIEAFVKIAGSRDNVIYGNHRPTEGVEYSLGITEDDLLEFVTSDGCSSTVSFQSTSSVQTDEWQHVAVTWDGETVIFYIDGQKVGIFPNTSFSCAFYSQYFVGIRTDNSGRFVGTMDELKVSDYAKSSVQIAESMSHDSQLDIGQCADRLIENESCMAGELCCTDTCEVSVDMACGDNGRCSVAGACILNDGRVDDGLLVLYEFSEKGGVFVADTSGVQPAIDLIIDNSQAVDWGVGSIRIEEDVIIASTTSTTKVYSSIAASNEFSLEAWVAPANLAQLGPSRIFSMSEDASLRNFTLGQDAEVYVARLLSTESDSNGLPLLDMPLSQIRMEVKQHIVVTRSTEGIRRFYVDGVLKSETQIGGTLSNWQAYPILIANELDGGRLWLGEIYLAAIYHRALTPIEVARNFSAGSESVAPPPPGD